MAEKYQNKYRIASARASWWNYGWAGAYFITICTANRQHFFGEIENGKMKLSSIGLLADVFWHEIKNHAKNVELGAFVVMPNHVHGILILDKPNIETNSQNESDSAVETRHVETRHALSLHALSLQTPIQTSGQIQITIESTEKNLAQQRFQNQGKNTISSILGSYKSAVTKHCNRLQLTDADGVVFGWQSRFHDHIIRNNEDYQRINDYIENNPISWENDKFFS